MPVQNSPPAKNTRSQRNPAVLTPTARTPLDRTPSVHQLSANLERGPPMEVAAPSRRSRSFSGLLGRYPGMSEGARARLGEAEDEEGEESEETEVVTALEGVPKTSEAANLAHSNQPLVSQDDEADDSIHWATHSSSCPQGQFQSPCIQDYINEGTLFF
ncbi:hypothetical protein O181_121026 [Austropuccinia psidii MF-1]|uniref:Uncharacterized protein n=1 Tax=Austropuccinia psidii MF-1 TaxID=1389203 RepID=A0A9Q3KIS7_9BASI|nr:hypothetical protein [Austropuccinia psidii MF-1]